MEPVWVPLVEDRLDRGFGFDPIPFCGDVDSFVGVAGKELKALCSKGSSTAGR